MGAAPIPYTAIVVYCDEFEIFDTFRNDFLDVIAAMDDAFLTHLAEKEKKSSAKTAINSGNRRKRH